MSQTTTEQSPAAPAQGTHHYLLTLQRPIPGGGGFAISTSSGTCTVPPGMTRHDVYTQLLAQAVGEGQQPAGAAVVFFDLQPNQL